MIVNKIRSRQILGYPSNSFIADWTWCSSVMAETYPGWQTSPCRRLH